MRTFLLSILSTKDGVKRVLLIEGYTKKEKKSTIRL